MKWLLKLFGWSIDITQIKSVKKSVIIEAPHTSNWDFIIGILAAISSEIKFHFIIKKEWDKPIIGSLLLGLGAIFINRSRASGLTQQIIEQFNKAKEGHIIFTPEGTRSRVNKWKTGFYTVAHEAKIPISVGYIDYKEKKIGIAYTFYPTGNMKDYCLKLKSFYETIHPKNNQNFQPDWSI